MCNNHSGVLIEVPTASSTYSDGSPRPDGNKRAIDACIAPLVKALNDAGFATIASCCGHGDAWGKIALTDGRELLIAPNYEAARLAETQQMPLGLGREVRLVRWVDSSGMPGWNDDAEVAGHGVADCWSVGFVVAEDDDQVLLAGSVDESHGNVADVIAIPKTAVYRQTNPVAAALEEQEN